MNTRFFMLLLENRHFACSPLLCEDIFHSNALHFVHLDMVNEPPQQRGSQLTGTNLVDGIRKDFKDAMDSYESFMDEYVALTNKYKENPNDLGMLSEYT